MATPLELREKRAKLIHDARQLLDSAEKDKRELTAEERGRWDAMLADADKHLDAATRIEKLEAAERSVTETQGRKTDPGQPNPGKEERSQADFFECELRDFSPRAPQGEKVRFEARNSEREAGIVRRAQPAYRAAFRSYLKGGENGLRQNEYRDLQADSDTQGGFLVPTQFAAKLISFVKNLVFVRQYATAIPVIGADSIGFPSLETDIDDADWTAELLTGNADAGLAFGKRELHPHPLAKQIKISNKLMRTSALDIESLVMDRMAYKFAVTEEKAFLTGTGSQQPLGVFVASAAGISTARDVSTGNTTTSMSADGLIECKYTLKVQYWKAGRWMFNRTGVKQIAKFKDGEGQYLFRPSLISNEPDQLLGFPMDMSEYCPNTFTTGQYVGLLGDWSRYWIADSLTMSVQRLVELYAATNQVGFIARKETDAMPVLEEAFVRVKLG